MNLDIRASDSVLGKKTDYEAHYNPALLFAIPRKKKRDEINIVGNLPFYGVDIWNHYEVSWLNSKGKPVVAVAEVIYPCESVNIIESKSMKLYFNSLNNTTFDDVEIVRAHLEEDISTRVGASAEVKLTMLPQRYNGYSLNEFEGRCIDELDIECSEYLVNASLLKTYPDCVEEVLYSNLLKSNCLVTHQPDWGSVMITYKGPKIDEAALLRYIVSFRNHNEFHEQCIERIFVDIMRYCKPEVLSVYGRYTRRGGIDINPYRSTQVMHQLPKNERLFRQ